VNCKADPAASLLVNILERRAPVKSHEFEVNQGKPWNRLPAQEKALIDKVVKGQGPLMNTLAAIATGSN